MKDFKHIPTSFKSRHQTVSGFSIPHFDIFGDLLYDRFHILLKHYGVLEKDLPYTIFLNIVDRSPMRKF